MATLNDPARHSDPVRPLEPFGPGPSVFLIRVFFWLVTTIVGFVQTWAVRFSIDADGNSYLDVASAYLRADYGHAINGHWSPMFSWLIALVLRIFHPSGYWETTAVHLLNFAGLLLGLRSFEFFFASFLAYLKRRLPPDGQPLLSEPYWWLLGLGLFFSTSLYVLTMALAKPDIWVCVITCLAMGEMLRIAVRPQRWDYYAALGLFLGLGYLTKSFYFPLSFVFLVSAFLASGRSRKGLLRTVLAFVVFAVIASPFVWALSKAKHRFDFGDAGKVAYAHSAVLLPQIPFWQGENHSGTPKHPTRQIISSPHVFEFAGPVGGSYPLLYDMSYWTEGIRPHFNFGVELRILRQSAGTFFLILLIQAEFLASFLILLFCKDRWRQVIASIVRIWPLWLSPSLACLAYSVVLVENRYVAPFLVFLWLSLFVGLLIPPSGASRRVVVAVVLGILMFTGLKAAKYFASDLISMRVQRNVDWEVAQSLGRIGVQPGDRVSVLGGKMDGHWARLAGVKIVAELPLGEDDIFWNSDRLMQDRVFAAFRSTGSRVVVVKAPPPTAKQDGWIPLGGTGYYAYVLKG